MKKFFALMLVVAMLSVAGIASATSITASPSSISVLRGERATSTVTGTASHNGTLTYSKIAGPEWATLSGTTVTFAPTADEAAGTKTPVVIEVIETFTTSGAAGHAGTSTDRAEVSIPVNVTVPANTDGGSEGATTTTVTTTIEEKETVSNVKVISMTVALIVNVTAPSQQQTVVESNVSLIRTLLSGLQALANLVSEMATAPVQKSDNIEVIESPNYNPDDNAANLSNASARLKKKTGNTQSRGTEKMAAGVIRPFASKQKGFQPVDMPKADKAFFGKKPAIDMGKRPKIKLTGASFFAADASGDNEAIFLNSLGNSTDVIPGTADDGTVYGDPSADAGVVTAVVFVEEGAEYEPIFFVEVASADVASFEEAAGVTTASSVDVTEVVIVETAAKTTATFSPVVAQSVRNAISDDYGKPVYELPYTAASSTAWTATDDEKTYMSENSLMRVCSLPALENVPDGVYVAEIVFDNQPGELGVNKVYAPLLYPDGVSGTATIAKTTVYVLDSDDYKKITVDNAATYIKNGQTAYLVFEVANNAVVQLLASDFEAAAVTLTRPSLVVETEAVVPPTPTTSDDAAVLARYAAYIDATTRTIKDAGFASDSVKFSSTVTSGTIKLNFPVATSSWKVTLQGYESEPITPSTSRDIGSITGATSTQATITFVPSKIAAGVSSSALARTVTLSVNPVSGDKEANAVTATLGTVTGTKEGAAPGDFGVGSSSSGCSAGSAALALAVLGAFIATRKK